jgi:uncharacterized protein (DUF2141 family)
MSNQLLRLTLPLVAASLSLSVPNFTQPMIARAQSPTATTSPAPNATTVAPGKLIVTVEGIQQVKGQVCFSLFASAQGFPSKADNALQSRCVDVTGNTVTMAFDKLQPGNYAVAAFHDVNKDGVLNQNGLGIPSERFGFSNNPRIFAGPPKFSSAAVLLAGQETNINIRLRGLLGN